MRRYADRRDENEPSIKDYLVRVGCRVKPISHRAVPDLLVGVGPFLLLLEVKMPGASLTPSQETFFEDWDGTHIFVVRSVTEAKKVVRLFMPIRCYICKECGIFERRENYVNEPIKECPTCGRVINQVYSVPQIVFKGDGWVGNNVSKEN